MAFSQGFEKQAASTAPTVARTMGQAVAAPAKALAVGAGRAVKYMGRQTKEFGKGMMSGLPPARKSPLTGNIKPERGESYAARQVSRKARKGELQFTPKTERELAQKKAVIKMKERHERMKQKPSFIQRYPVTSGVGTYAGYKYLTSPSKEDPEPRVMYPQN
jgi:hypothetical protein